MAKTITLNFTLAVAAATLLAACDQPPMQQRVQQPVAVCVQNGVRVPDTSCSRSRHAGGGWYYYGRGALMPYYGERVAGGSFTRTPGATYFHAPVSTGMSRTAAISRGGFGASAHSFGSGRS